MIIKNNTGSSGSQIPPLLSRKYVAVLENCEKRILPISSLSILKYNCNCRRRGYGGSLGATTL